MFTVTDEYVIFITPTSLQKKIFTAILNPNALSALLKDSMVRTLAMIRQLTKISTSPALLKKEGSNGQKKHVDDDEEDQEAADNVLNMLANISPDDVEISGKTTIII